MRTPALNLANYINTILTANFVNARSLTYTWPKQIKMFQILSKPETARFWVSPNTYLGPDPSWTSTQTQT